MGSVKTLLLSIFKELSENQFKEFKLFLEEKGIALSELENAARGITINLMVGHFTDNAAPTAIEILREIGRKDLAEQLTQRLTEMKGNPGVSSGTAAGGASSPQGTAASDVHFVDRHREALIQRVYNVSPILDTLLDEKVVTQEKYDEVMVLNIKQDQLRRIYSGPLRSAGIRGKDILYEALRELEPFLVEDLEKKDRK